MKKMFALSLAIIMISMVAFAEADNKILDTAYGQYESDAAIDIAYEQYESDAAIDIAYEQYKSDAVIDIAYGQYGSDVVIDVADNQYIGDLAYLVRSGEGSSVMYTLKTSSENPEETLLSEEFMQLKDDNGEFIGTACVRFDEGTNYIPLRYLSEKFGAKDIAGDVNLFIKDSEKAASGLDDYKAVFEAYINEKNYKTPVFAYKDINYQNEEKVCVLLFNGEETFAFVKDELVPETNEGLSDDLKKDLASCKVLIKDDRTYVPLRTLQLLHVGIMYDGNTGLIGIIMSEDETVKDTVFDKAKAEYAKLQNQGYVNYNRMYLDNKGELSAVPEGYGVNRFGNILMYVGSDFGLYAEALDENGARILGGAQKISENNKFYDIVIFDGLNVYAVETGKSGDFYGNIISAKLTLTADGKFALADKKTIRGGKNKALTMCKERLYFISEEEGGHVLVSLNLKTGDAKKEGTYIGDNDLFSYSVCNDPRFSGLKYVLAGDQSKNIMFSRSDSGEDGVINYSNSEAYMRNAVANPNPDKDNLIWFYYITEKVDGDIRSNQIYVVRDKGGMKNEVITSYPDGTTIKNLVILDGVLYASVNGAVLKICDVK